MLYLRLLAVCALFAPTSAVVLSAGMAQQRFAAAPARSLVAMVDAKTVKQLRDATGAGMMDCKKALVEFEGDMEKATEMLRAKGLASAEKKAGRAAKEGIVETYIHTGAKLGVMVEVRRRVRPTRRWRIGCQR